MSRLEILNRQMRLLEELKNNNAIGQTRYIQVKKIIVRNLKQLEKEGK